MPARLLGLALAVLCAAAAQAQPQPFSPAELRRILSHGPWPMPAAADPANRVSGNPDAIALGEVLFFDVRLSGNGQVSCATCHEPERGWSDGRKTAVGVAAVDRNTPGLLNVRLNRWFGWDGGSDSLMASAVRPWLDARETGASAPLVAGVLRQDAALACRYRKAFGELDADAEATMANAAKAIAAFQETLASSRTPFDDFRDALAAGRDDPAYPEAARRGLKIFVGKGDCQLCHFGPNFTNGEFHDTGISQFIAPGKVDNGRFGGIGFLRQSPFSLLGRFNDDASGANAVATRHVETTHRNWGEFKVPTLRNLDATAPYMHNGSLATLRDVVRHYSEVSPDRVHSDGEALIRALHLSEPEIDDLVAFLRTLSVAADNRPFQRRHDPRDCE
ncbi:MAG: cytochrome-c peroxidase [Reyranellaceae bacterium]